MPDGIKSMEEFHFINKEPNFSTNLNAFKIKK